MDPRQSDKSFIPHQEELPTVLRAAINELRRENVEDEVVDRAVEYALQLPAAIRPPEPTKPRNRITHWFGGFTMRQKITLGSMAVTVLLGLFLVWQGFEAKPLSAMEQMAENVRKAKSCKYTFKISHDRGKARVSENVGTVYWLASGSQRMERIEFTDANGPQNTTISYDGKPSIYINHVKRTFGRLRASHDVALSAQKLEDLGNFSGKADRDLGSKEINGKKVHGFQIRFDNDISRAWPPQQWEVWLDNESSLPVLAQSEDKRLDETMTEIDADIQWNVDLDQRLFDSTPPTGYTDATPAPPNEQQVRQIVESLSIYADASGGHYPLKEHVNVLDAIDDLCRILGVATWPDVNDSGNARKAARAIEGFQRMGELNSYNLDPAYYGKTVTPKDKNKVLLRWKLDDGKYEVIFGDLRGETVTAEKLQELEGKSK